MSGKETYNKRGMKPLSELTLLDRFLFSCAMEDPRILELSLKIILDQKLELKALTQTEKEFRTMPWLRSIRLDNLEEGVGKERILMKVMKRFSVTEQKAEEYYERFAVRQK